MFLLNYNIRSLNANFDQFHGFYKSLNKKFDVICFTESWLKNDNKQLFSIDGYDDFHSLRSDGRRGGGISVFISNSFDAKIIKQSTIIHKCIETLFIEITRLDRKILIAVAYKPNKSDDQFFIDKLCNHLNKNFKTKYDEIILTGDFNFDLLKHEENNSTLNFLSSLTSLSLIPVISKPTRITDTSATLIDNIFVLNPVNFTSGIIVSDISDHFPTYINIKDLFLNKNSDSCKTLKYRLINETTINEFCLNVSSHDFSDIENLDDCSAAMDQLTDVIDDAFKMSCPIKTKNISYKNFIKPWISNEIVKLIKKRQNYYILYRKNVISKKTYSNYRNFVTNEIRKVKKKYYVEKFNAVKNDIKKTWCIINDVLRSKARKKQNTIRKIIVNDVIHENPNHISNAFNDFFVDIGKNIAESVGGGLNDHKQYLSHINIPHSFFFKPILPSETSQIINSLKNKSSNLNTIPTKLLKSIRNIISIPLTNLINDSFTSGTFPDSLKIARVTPIYKEGKKTDLNNYRPISVLPIISKVFEKIAHKQLYKFLEQNSLLDNSQFGFRSNKSTTHAILNFMNYLHNNLDNGNLVFSIFLDFRKAFDSVNHEILLSKLHTYGIRGNSLDWFRSYLTNRKQYVCINNVNSSLKLVEYGVPQGSILGPLLFLIFINDITKCSKLFKYILYADDSTLSTGVNESELEKHVSLINDELNNLYTWLNSNKIAINKKKTKFMIFTCKKSFMISHIQIGNDLIEEADNIKFLGIHLDNHLNFKHHISETSKKLSKSIGLLHKLKHFLPFNILKILYSSLIQPYLTYGLEAWHGTYKNYTKKIFVLQKKAIRAMNNLNYNDHTNEYFKSANILKLDDQYRLQTSNYIYKLLNTNNIDQEMSTILLNSMQAHSHDTRNKKMINVAHVKRSKTKNNIFHNGVKTWNSLPIPVKNCNSFYKFKRMAKASLHGQY